MRKTLCSQQRHYTGFLVRTGGSFPLRGYRILHIVLELYGIPRNENALTWHDNCLGIELARGLRMELKE